MLYVVILICFFVIGAAAGFVLGRIDGEDVGYDAGWHAAMAALDPEDDPPPGGGHELRLVHSAPAEPPARRHVRLQQATA